ncbi:MAG: 4-hydroxythreonine-4-phosphate dehydrogenase PdxA [bacterium]|nr:4-hydroxythreonine-4-phosphate dehydrogenase PdxA [bacterium]
MGKPVIGITMGDPAGIGPEIIGKILLNKNINRICVPLVIGDKRFFVVGANGRSPLCKINIIDLKNADPKKIPVGKISAQAGKASIEYIDKAVELIRKGDIQAMVTAPINKESVSLAGLKFPGHTEYLAHLTKTKKFAMMLAGGKIRVVLVTTHMALRDVARNITADKIYEKISIANAGLTKWFGKKKPLIAVCSLNPHGGEGGLFGGEEAEFIEPAIKKAKKENIRVEGPFASDTLFVKANQGMYDAVIVMYHDQGLIPLKMASFGNAVNITLGLPFIRTSVDHGTAFDIAGKGIAGTGSMEAAIKLATQMVKSMAHRA